MCLWHPVLGYVLTESVSVVTQVRGLCIKSSPQTKTRPLFGMELPLAWPQFNRERPEGPELGQVVAGDGSSESEEMIYLPE